MQQGEDAATSRSGPDPDPGRADPAPPASLPAGDSRRAPGSSQARPRKHGGRRSGRNHAEKGGAPPSAGGQIRTQGGRIRHHRPPEVAGGVPGAAHARPRAPEGCRTGRSSADEGGGRRPP